MKTALKVIIPLIITGLLIWYMSTIIDPAKVIINLKNADYTWVAITIAISLLAHLSRAYRWNLLMEPMGYKPPLGKTFMAVMIGYFGNIFIPRMGEVLRCMVLNWVDRVPFKSSFGTVVAERVFDFICLLTLIGISLLMEFDRFSTLIKKIFVVDEKVTEKVANNYVFIIVMVILLVAIVVLFILRKRIINSPLYGKGKEFLLGLWQGIISIKTMKRKWAFLLHTFIIWGCYYFMTYLIFFSLPATANLSPLAGLVILIVGGLGMSAPASGGIGPFHLMVAGALQLFYGLTKDDGVAYAFVIHTSQLMTISVVGLISLVICLFVARKFKANSKETQAV
ncbi:MAG TPA: lysylphosphatidylglycerol synthase transmembrane domain-containing protein [Cytophagaceae bacterium]|nr:lysylphosphatidylglycerol synthase transmembrane domain-containing protein [Cytophagaceae bacterium]